MVPNRSFWFFWLFVLVLVFKVYFLREREREREGGREGERERMSLGEAERIPSRLYTVSVEPDAGLDLMNREIMT